MPGKASFLQFSRKTHLYFGVLISPALLFFALTGAIQTLGLHEASANYQPPALLASLGQIHKKQTYLLPAHRAPGPKTSGVGTGHAGPAPAEASRPDADRPAAVNAGTRPAQQAQPTLQVKQKQHLPLKLFFVIVSLGLLTNTLTGIYMSYIYDRNKLLISGLLLAGVLLPIILLRF